MPDAQNAELKTSTRSPWYCLATVYGERGGKLDQELSDKNRIAWNRWVAGGISEETRTKLIKNGFPEHELIKLDVEEQAAFYEAFKLRTGNDELPPDANEHPDFAFTRFDDDVDFRGFLFAHGANFGWSTFTKSADFASAIFLKCVDFGATIFSQGARFSAATFSNLAHFGAAVFCKDANFGSATFAKDVNFGSVNFSALADFSSAVFLQRAYFGWSTFEVANFGSATFSKDADFDSVTFFVRAVFCFTTFKNDVYFVSAFFLKGATFRSADCCRGVSFVKAKFADNTTFSGAGFATHVPDFRGATMHEATEWQGVIWPKFPRNKDAAGCQVYAYEWLKRETERLRKLEDRQRFYRKQLRASRGLERLGSGPWLLNFLYDAFSNYGQSVSRPLSWMALFFAIGCLIFARTQPVNGTHLSSTAAAILSFVNLFSFLPIKFAIVSPDMIIGLSSFAHIFGVAQSLFGALMVFLVGLALHNRFHLR